MFKAREKLAKYPLLILDDFGVTLIKPQAKADVLQILDDRVGVGSTIFVGQRPYSDWHEFIDEPLIADAVLDRLSSNHFQINLQGVSQRCSEPNLSTVTK
jgi:DNA replication protein DnaC